MLKMMLEEERGGPKSIRERGPPLSFFGKCSRLEDFSCVLRKRR
jgi:hypothetical protein